MLIEPREVHLNEAEWRKILAGQQIVVDRLRIKGEDFLRTGDHLSALGPNHLSTRVVAVTSAGIKVALKKA